MRLPNHNLKLAAPKDSDGWELGIYRDKLGNVQVGLWKCGQGFRDMFDIHHRDVEKLHSWLGKIIEHVRRP